MEEEHLGVLLITANVGSIFEEPDQMFKPWLREFLNLIEHLEPCFIALHCQEVGGKNYEASMQHVNHFVKTILASEQLVRYDRARVFLDEDYTASDKFTDLSEALFSMDCEKNKGTPSVRRDQDRDIQVIDRIQRIIDAANTQLFICYRHVGTALGNMYFIHDAVEDVHIFDFVENKFVAVEGREVLSGNIENIQIKEKAKFPQHFFPETYDACSAKIAVKQVYDGPVSNAIFALQFKWSRKGFLRTRWNLNNCIFDLVNIHLFHDASNIIAMEASPSIYNGNRQQALMHTLKRFESDQYDKVPMILFGDFNFRLDTNLLIKALTAKTTSEQTRGKKDQISRIVYTEEGNEKVVLTVEAKSFDYHEKHEDLFFNTNKWLRQYDTEMQPFQERLFEYDITFPPSYPFSEDVNDGTSYMKTRCPSWCDRILLSYSAKDIIYQDEKFHRPHYHLIGKEVCMGDHKPVYLSIHLKPGKGNLSESFSPSNRSVRKKMLSINGEEFEGVDLTKINIHDYAVFEKEHDLLPEFRTSIRSRTESGTVINDSESLVPAKPSGRRKSFQEVALQIRTYQRILREWPRNRARHHSSSSEDFCEDETVDNYVTEDKNVTEDKSPKQDIKSVTTDVSQISDKSVQSTSISDPSTPPSGENPNNSLMHASPVSVTEHAQSSSSPSHSADSSSVSPTHERSVLVGKPKVESSPCCTCVVL